MMYGIGLFSGDLIKNVLSLIYMAWDTISTYAPMASIAVLVYVRVKYHKNVFSKVLIILYVILFIITLIFLIFGFFSCINAIQSCPG